MFVFTETGQPAVVVAHQFMSEEIISHPDGSITYECSIRVHGNTIAVMTDAQINEAIAKACGIKDIEPSRHVVFFGTDLEGDRVVLPDYVNDLNAMHEAEKVLTRAQRIKFVGELCAIVGVKWRPTSHFDTIHATPRQKAEAFLRTLNLWVEPCAQCGGTGFYTSEAQARLPDHIKHKCDLCNRN